MEEYVDEATQISNNKEVQEAYDMEYEYTNIGFERGVQAGTEQGHTEEKYKIAKSMLNDKVDDEIISKYTNLTLDDISSLKENAGN